MYVVCLLDLGGFRVLLGRAGSRVFSLTAVDFARVVALLGDL